MEGNHTRVDTVKWDLSQVAICNKLTLMSSIMFDIKDKVDSNLLVIIRGLSSFSKVNILYSWSWVISRAVESCHLVFPLCLSSSRAWL